MLHNGNALGKARAQCHIPWPHSSAVVARLTWPQVNAKEPGALAPLALDDSDILITGSGKIHKAGCAKFAHEQSRRAHRAFVSVDCAEIARRGGESALFGQMEGAPGEARLQDPIAAAEGGTLFLDEVHALSLLSQTQLLRFLEDKEYRRLGETCQRRANVRLIAATGADVSVAIQERRFCEELLIHLRVISIEIPWLWRRVAGIRFLVSQCLNNMRSCLPKLRHAKAATVAQESSMPAATPGGRSSS